MTKTQSSANTKTNTTRPSLNRTSYQTVQQKLNGGLTAKFYAEAVALLASQDWRDKVPEEDLTTTSLTFLDETEYASETIIAAGSELSGGGNRLILESVNGVGTSTIELRLREWHAGTGLNNAPWLLVLVRIPNHGTEPERAIAHFDKGGPIRTATTSAE